MEKLDLIKAILGTESQDTPTLESGSKWKIVVLQRGWVFVGKFSQEGSKCTLTDAKNIRTWGTTKGLGELASDGPTSSTKLDPVNDVSFHALTTVVMIDCNDSVWKKV